VLPAVSSTSSSSSTDSTSSNSSSARVPNVAVKSEPVVQEAVSAGVSAVPVAAAGVESADEIKARIAAVWSTLAQGATPSSSSNSAVNAHTAAAATDDDDVDMDTDSS
jgi:hypothetical protein